jgi:hypothetical protein
LREKVSISTIEVIQGNMARQKIEKSITAFLILGFVLVSFLTIELKLIPAVN